MPALSDEHRYKLLKLLADNPDLNQRQISSALGISLGKVNFCLQALIAKGLVKASNFGHNPDKRKYRYLLTLQGIEEKARVTLRFLDRKQREYQQLKAEIAQLQQEARALARSPHPPPPPVGAGPAGD